MNKIVTAALSIVGAFSLAVTARIVNPDETVNALWLVVASACLFTIAYRLYGAFIAARVLSVDPARTTPAYALEDGKDYHPINRWVLFGHHFASIAGAGPLIGPILAAQFGYLPGFLWILVGAVFGGAVHDTVILFASVRRRGSSLATIAKEEVGTVTGLAVALAILFIVVIALAGLGLAVVNALYKSPWATFTVVATIPIAVFMGLYLKTWRKGKVAEITAIGVVLLLLSIIGGSYIQGSSIDALFNYDRAPLIWALAFYGFIASVLPVWLLLAPRDYLSTFMKVGAVVLLAAGVVVLAPEVKMPPTTEFIHGGGPVIPGTVFPFMFITIACGAVSGFHSLISSGTTPKMLRSEADIRFIGFGAMLFEGFVAIMALVAAGVLIPGDYFAINTNLSADALSAMGFPPVNIGELSDTIGVTVSGRPGGAVGLAVGMAYVFSAIYGMKALMPYWYNFALLFEALFIMTTIDTGTRIARYILQELLGHVVAPFGKKDWMPGVLITTGLVVASWGWLIASGSVATIWPMFGVANQLLSALALCVATTVLIKMGKTRYALTTFVPMIFMSVMTLTASWKLFWLFLDKAKIEPLMAFTHKLNAALVLAMAALAIVAIADSLRKWRYLPEVPSVVAAGGE